MNYKEMIVLDTNIILNDHENLELLSNHSENILVLPEIVLDELDSKKSGFDEINFQARAFGRLFGMAEVKEVSHKGDLIITETFINSGKHLTILVVSKSKYKVDSDHTIPANISNDRKIIEVTLGLSEIFKNVVFLSLDNMARYRALSLGVQTRKFSLSEKEDVELFDVLEIDEGAKPSYDAFEIESFDVDPTVQGLEIRDAKGSHFYYRTGTMFKQIDEGELKRQNIAPRNIGQKILSAQIQDEFHNVVVSDSPAGSGKTLIALSNAMRLLDTHKDRYDKIVYIRKTVISDTEELGFMPGTLEEKMSGYLAPLYSNIEFIIEQKFKGKGRKLTKEDLEDKISEMLDKYQIQAMYEGHLRGGNIRNAILILDEAQNNSVSSAKTILTRVGENCKVIVLGSNRQIDSKYLNKFNNALTYLINRIGEDNMNVNLTGFPLTKTVRSSISEWADTFKG
jgi:PhoH-like ATPase